jgi:hypothetical protein
MFDRLMKLIRGNQNTGSVDSFIFRDLMNSMDEVKRERCAKLAYDLRVQEVKILVNDERSLEYRYFNFITGHEESNRMPIIEWVEWNGQRKLLSIQPDHDTQGHVDFEKYIKKIGYRISEVREWLPEEADERRLLLRIYQEDMIDLFVHKGGNSSGDFWFDQLQFYNIALF